MFLISKIQENFFSLYSQKQVFENKKLKTVTKHNLKMPWEKTLIAYITCGNVVNATLLIQVEDFKIKKCGYKKWRILLVCYLDWCK